MDIAHPVRSVIPSVHGAVLGVLAATTEHLNGRQVAELADGQVSPKGAYNALQDLVGSGIVSVEVRPREKLYSLNRRHLAAPAIEQLAMMRHRLLDELRSALAAWEPPPDGAWLFGSAARGDGGPSSDIDVLLVRPASVGEDDARWSGQVDQLTDDVRAWTGNACAVIEYSPRGLTNLMTGSERLADELRADAICLAGAIELRDLRRPRRA